MRKIFGMSCMFILAAQVFYATSCVTSQAVVEKSVAKRRIIDQTPGAEGLPAWIKKPNGYLEDGKVVYKAIVEMDADSRSDACTQAAALSGKGKIANTIATSVVDESGLAGDDKTLVFERLTTSLAKQKLIGIEIVEEYWDLVEIDDGINPVPIRKMECWAKVTIDKKRRDDAMNRALIELKKDPKVKKYSDRIEESLKKQHEDVDGNSGSSSAPAGDASTPADKPAE